MGRCYTLIPQRVEFSGKRNVNVCMVITYSKSMDQPGKVINPARGPLTRGKRIFPCPRSRLRNWPRETSSAVPSRVSLLILHTQAESGAYSRDSSRFPRRRPFIRTAIRHRVSPDFIGSRNCVPMALTAESPPTQGQYSSR